MLTTIDYVEIPITYVQLAGPDHILQLNFSCQVTSSILPLHASIFKARIATQKKARETTQSARLTPNLSMTDFLSLIIFASFLWLAVEFASERRQIKGLEVFQKQAIEQFRSYQTQSTTAVFNFIGSEAEIVRSKEDIV